MRTSLDAPTLRVEARFKNARLYNAIVADAAPALSAASNGRATQRLGPIKPWCDLQGISCALVYQLINLQLPPMIWRRDDTGARVLVFRPLCERLAGLLGWHPADLFPADLYRGRWPHLVAEVDHHAMMPLLAAPRRAFELPPTQETVVEQGELIDAIGETLQLLTPRQEKVLALRYGLNGGGEESYDVIAALFGVTRERIRQIETDALKKLRQPAYYQRLRPFVTPRHASATTATARLKRAMTGPLYDFLVHSQKEIPMTRAQDLTNQIDDLVHQLQANLATSGALAADPQCLSHSQELANQIDDLVHALQAELAEPTDVIPPEPPDGGGIIRTSEELVAALAVGGAYEVAAGEYVGNFIVSKPTALVGLDDPVLRPLDEFEPTLQIHSGQVTVEGLAIENGKPDRECVVVGFFEATDVAQQPDGVLIEDCLIVAGPNGGHRGIALHGRNLTVRHCRVTGFWEAGRDSQAIWIHNGPGPYTVEDCYLEASGEVILTGGASVAIPNCVPSDIVIQRNTCYKPDSWRSNGATVKNCIELKNARRVLIEGNVLDGNWRSGQTGIPIVLTVRNQEGDSPWVIVDEVIIRANQTIRCADAAAVSILGSDDTHPSEQTRTILIERNLFTDSPAGFLIGNGVSVSLVIRNNTLPVVANTFLQFYDTRSDNGTGRPAEVRSPLAFVENVLRTGEYGAMGSDCGCGLPSIDAYTVVEAWEGNVVEVHPDRTVPLPNPDANWELDPGGLVPILDPLTFKLIPGTPYGNAGYY